MTHFPLFVVLMVWRASYVHCPKNIMQRLKFVSRVILRVLLSKVSLVAGVVLALGFLSLSSLSLFEKLVV